MRVINNRTVCKESTILNIWRLLSKANKVTLVKLRLMYIYVLLLGLIGWCIKDFWTYLGHITSFGTLILIYIPVRWNYKNMKMTFPSPPWKGDRAPSHYLDQNNFLIIIFCPFELSIWFRRAQVQCRELGPRFLARVKVCRRAEEKENLANSFLVVFRFATITFARRWEGRNNPFCPIIFFKSNLFNVL